MARQSRSATQQVVLAAIVAARPQRECEHKAGDSGCNRDDAGTAFRTRIGGRQPVSVHRAPRHCALRELWCDRQPCALARWPPEYLPANSRARTRIRRLCNSAHSRDSRKRWRARTIGPAVHRQRADTLHDGPPSRHERRRKMNVDVLSCRRSLCGDATKDTGSAIGTIADYVAVLSLSVAQSPDHCDPLPSIPDLMSSNCGTRDRPTAITAGDLAFLRALYFRNIVYGPSPSRSTIEYKMRQQFKAR